MRARLPRKKMRNSNDPEEVLERASVLKPIYSSRVFIFAPFVQYVATDHLGKWQIGLPFEPPTHGRCLV